MAPSTRTLRGKYQLTKHVFVCCYLDILEATDQDISLFLGIKKRSDSLVPIGTRIFFNAEIINKINARRTNTFDEFSVRVLSIEDSGGKPLHKCSPIQKETRSDLRKEPRKAAHFQLQLKDAKTEFIAIDGTASGLTLHYKAKKAMLSLKIGQAYEFMAAYKGVPYSLPGKIQHIQYDWRSHEHVIGVHFSGLSQEQQVILNLLIDPEYTIEIDDKQTVDTTAGKVSLQEDL